MRGDLSQITRKCTICKMRMLIWIIYKAKVNIVYIEVHYHSLHNQNKNRDAVVPAGVIDKLVRKLEVPALWEAHNVVYRIR